MLPCYPHRLLSACGCFFLLYLSWRSDCIWRELLALGLVFMTALCCFKKYIYLCVFVCKGGEGAVLEDCFQKSVFSFHLLVLGTKLRS